MKKITAERSKVLLSHWYKNVEPLHLNFLQIHDTSIRPVWRDWKVVICWSNKKTHTHTHVLSSGELHLKTLQTMLWRHCSLWTWHHCIKLKQLFGTDWEHTMVLWYHQWWDEEQMFWVRVPSGISAGFCPRRAKLVTPPAKTLPARPNNGKLGVAFKVPTGEIFTWRAINYAEGQCCPSQQSCKQSEWALSFS